MKRQVDGLICKLIIWLGLRPGEFRTIRKSDINFMDRIIILRDTKSGNDQETPIPDVLLEDLQQLTNGLKDDAFVFTNTRGRPIGRRQVGKLMKNWARERGLENVTPRVVRRSLMKILSLKGATDFGVESLLRHEGSSTNREFYSPIDPEAAREALKKHPARDC